MVWAESLSLYFFKGSPNGLVTVYGMFKNVFDLLDFSIHDLLDFLVNRARAPTGYEDYIGIHP